MASSGDYKGELASTYLDLPTKVGTCFSATSNKVKKSRKKVHIIPKIS